VGHLNRSFHVQMNRRSFFGVTLSTLGTLGLARVLRCESVFAAPEAKAAGKKVQATEESLKGLEKAKGLKESNFWNEKDTVATVVNFCDASIEKNKKCGEKRQPGQYCGNCVFLTKREAFEGDVAGKCQLIPDKPPKTHVHGHTYCGSYVANPAFKYAIKA
jgi:hypothetical protein